jgi:predicted RNase H-like nuclease
MIAGVDGTARGWVAVLCDDDLTAAKPLFLRRLADLPRGLHVAAVDVPIGLPEKGPRDADRLARKALGEPRGRSVFPTPVRSVLGATSWEDACARHERADGRRVSKQTFGILPKVAEADALVRFAPWAGSMLNEAHPELCFATWAGAPMIHGKKTRAGREERLALISRTFGQGIFESAHGVVRRDGVLFDDLADAFAAAWTAARIHAGTAEPLPKETTLDAEGVPMQIWA